MRNIVRDYVDKFLHERQARIRLARILIILGLVVTAVVFWELRYTGIALTNETNCGLEEHTHTDECYEEVLVCGQEESAGHVHTDACYETQIVLICGEEESPDIPAVEGHTHTDACYTTNTYTTLICGQEEGEEHTHTDECYATETETVLICGQEESESIPAVEGHTHTDACYETQTVLVCGYEEGDPDGGHVHTDACYEKQLVCGKEEHTHTLACMSDDTADVETASAWESTLPDRLTGIWVDDLISVAQSQLGYTESTENYIVNDSGDKKGYTRYGAWYGDPYGDWCAMYVSFCLNYAGIGTDLMPRNSGCYAWTVDLSNRGMYASSSSYTPKVGDIVFFDWNGDGRSNHVGIVEEVTYRTADGRTLSDEEAKNVYVDESGRTVINVDTEVEVVVDLEVDPDEVTEEGSEEVTDAETADEDIEIEFFEEDVAEDASEEIAEDVEAEDTDRDLDDAADEEDSELEAGTATETVEVYATAIKTIEGNSSNMVREKSYDAASSSILGYGIFPEQPEEEIAAILGLESVDADTSGEEDDMEAAGEVDEEAGAVVYEADVIDEIGETADAEDMADAAETTDTTMSRVEALSSGGPIGGITFIAGANAIVPLDAGDGDEGSEHGGDGDHNGDIDITNVDYNEATYNEDENRYETHFHIDFTVNSDDLEYDPDTGYYDECELLLPVGVEVPERYWSGTYPGYDSGDTHAFDFWFVWNEEEDAWEIVIQFLPGYFEQGNENCYVEFDVWLDADDFEEDGEGHYTFDDDVSIDVPITPGQPSTSGGDVSTTKTNGGYDEATSSITYTITVSSTRGTGDVVTVTDQLNLSEFELAQNPDGSYSIELGSVTYVGDILDADGNVTGQESKTLTDCNIQITPTGDGTYTITITDSDGNGLPAMSTNSTYTITYTIYLADLDEDWLGQATANNGITVSSTDKWDNTITDKSTSPEVSISRSRDLLEKTGLQNDDGTITWTITVNTGTYPADLAGWTLTDEAFADMDNFKMVYKDGNDEVEAQVGVDFNWVYGDDGSIIGIEFIGTDPVYDESGALIGYENRHSYTITYTQTDVDGPTLGNKDTVSNKATLEEEEVEAEVEPGIDYTGGSLDKGFEGEADNGDGTITIDWSVLITVPEAGIDSGTVIEDYQGDWDNDKQSYEHDGTDGWRAVNNWLTRDQVVELFSGLYQNGMTFTAGDGSTVTIYDAETGAETTLTYGSGYTIQVYDLTTHDWVDLDEIMDNASTYADHKFTAWQITFNKSVTLSEDGSLSLDYSSTCDSGDTDAHYNSIFIGQLSKTVHDDQTELVTKSDGSGNLGSSEVTVSNNGLLTWIVTVHIPHDGSGTTFVVTDTLPAGTTLEQVYIDMNQEDKLGGWINEYVITRNADGTYTIGTYWSSSQYGGVEANVSFQAEVTVYDSSGNEVAAADAYDENGDLKDPTYYQVVTITLPQIFVDMAKTFDTGGYFHLTFEVKISDDDLEAMKEAYNDGEVLVNTYTNGVEVSCDNSKYGSSTQTEEVTYDHDRDVNVTKMMEYVEDDDTPRQLECSVLLNPEGDDLLIGQGGDLDWIDFWDTMTIVNNTDAGVYVTLDPTSVSFCEVIELTPTNSVGADGYGTYWYLDSSGTRHEVEYTAESTDIYVSEIGNLYLIGDELDVTWTYEADTDGNVYKITASIPDETAILVRYTYNYLWRHGVDPTTVNVKNEAGIHGSSDWGDTQSEEENLGDTSISAGVYNDKISIWKVDKDNYGKLLAGATFALEWWDSTSQDWVAVADSDGNALTYTSSSTGSIEISEQILTELGAFEANRAYRLVEIEAPVGYVMDGTDVYFYWSSTDTTTYPPCYPTDSFTDVGGSYNATDLNNFSYEYYWKNNSAPTEQIEVQKLWKYDNGTYLTSEEAANLSATVQLYYYLSSKQPDGWEGDLPTMDAGGSAIVTVTVRGGVTAETLAVDAGTQVTVTLSVSDSETWYSPIENNYTVTVNGTVISLTPSEVKNSHDQIISLTYVIPAEYVTDGSRIVLADDTQDGYGQFDISITSEKLSSGSTTEPGPEEEEEIIKEGSYIPYVDSDGNTYIYTLDQSNNWYEKIDDLPEYEIDDDGTVWWYYYYFVELEVPSGWTTEYETTHGEYTIQNGVLVSGSGVDGVNDDANNYKDEVFVVNTSSTRVELPKAGGIGTRRLALIGVLIIATGAGVLLYRENRRKRRCER